MSLLRWQRLGWVIAVASLALSLGFAVLPGRVSVTPLSPGVVPTAPPMEPPTLATDAAESIAMANIFSATRSAPTRRFVPPELMNESAAGMVAPPDSFSALPEVASELPTLLGTVVGPDGPRALLLFTPTSSTSRLVAAGDRVDGWRILSIAPGHVVVRGPAGRVTLRLAPEPRP